MLLGILNGIGFSKCLKKGKTAPDHTIKAGVTDVKVDFKLIEYVPAYTEHNITAGITDVVVNFYRDWETDRKSTRLNSSHSAKSRMPSSA